MKAETLVGRYVVVRRRGGVRGLIFSSIVSALVASVPGLMANGLDLGDRGQALTQYKVDTWQTEQGLPLNTVQSVLQTRDGYLWVGTGGGLARFDGVRFTTFAPAAVPALAAKPIFGLMEDAGGALWMGHSDGAAFYRNGRFSSAFGPEVTGGRRVWGFAQARDGSIWAATENGLVHWQNGVRRVYRKADGLPNDRLRSVAFDRDGILWIATTGGGLVSFDGRRFSALTTRDGFPHLAVRSVLSDPAGGIWAATAGGGLAHVVGRSVRTYGVKDGLPTDQLTSLTRDANGSLWIGTWGAGIVRMRDGRFTSLSTEGGIAGGQIWSVHADREGSVWVGTWVGGLNRLRTRDFVVLGTPEGLSHDNVRSVLHARSGAAWVTTAGGGVNRIDGGRITAIRKKDGLPSDETSCILEDRDGAIWIGTYTGGVARLKNEVIERFGPDRGIVNLDVRSMYQDRSGTVWIGTMSGLLRFDGERFNPVREPGAPLEGVSAILQDRDGTMWFATGEGLFRYRAGVFNTFTRTHGLLSNWIMSLYEDGAGSLWIGTNGEGLNRLKDGKFAAIPPSAGLWDGMAQVIVGDRLGNLWLTCNRGFFRVSLAELDAFADGRVTSVHSAGYGPGDALRSTTFAGGHQPAGALDAAGRVWLPSFSGVVIVDPMRLPGWGEHPTVRLEEVTVDGVEVAADSVVLPPGSVPLSIRYTTTSLRNSERVRFRYRMNEEAWVDAGHRREAFFPALPHGEYRFEVAASADGEHWRAVAAPLQITVRPRFYQTPWFIALSVITLLGLAWCIGRLRTRNLRRQKTEMERLVAERTEELRLANEHLARLSFVDSLTGLANRRRFDEALEQEWQRARRFSTSLSLIVADVDLFKAYNDSLGHLEGDKCLAAVADVLRNSGRRAGDVVARYGGEEFVMLIPATTRESAMELAEAVRRACEERAIPHPASSISNVVTISLGVAARVPADDASSELLLQDADKALYAAKRGGRNRVA